MRKIAPVLLAAALLYGCGTTTVHVPTSPSPLPPHSSVVPVPGVPSQMPPA